MVSISSNKPLFSYPDLIYQLYLLCDEGKTGSLFISTNDNRAICFVLKNGRIVSCSSGHWRGRDALSSMRNIVAGTFAFSEKVFFSLSDETTLPSTEEILLELGYEYTANSTQPTSISVEKPLQIYRGTIVTNPNLQEITPAVMQKKPQLVYRGQVVKR